MLACLLCGACADRKVIETASLRLAPSQWIRVNTGTLKIKSRRAEVCVPLPDGYKMLPAGGRLAIHDLNGRQIRLSERFVSASGATVNGDGPWLLSNGRISRACFQDWNDTIGREFTAIELKSSDTLSIRALEWETGKRYGAP